MINFENSVVIAQPIEKVYAFLKDLRNHEALMPSNIEDWSATEDEAKFNIKNMAKISLIVNNREENKTISAVPKEKAPIDLALMWDISDDGNGNTKASFTIKADLNMMLKMIASGPLQKLVDHQVKKLQEVLA